MQFIVVRGPERRMREIERYLYAGQSVISEPVPNMFGSHMVIVESQSDNAQYVADRLMSGMFGAVVFDTREDADNYIAGEM